MTVNGKSWPYLSVAPRKYRFRMLDGCNARFLNMWLKNLDTSANGPKITVVGTDGGLLDSPVDLDPASGKTVFMAPGERLDVVIDFTGVAEGTVFTLMNDAKAPYPTGDPVVEGLTDRIMQFVVNGKLIDATSGDPTGSDKSFLPSNLRTANPMIKLTDFAGNLAPGVTSVVKRQILLNEVTGAGGPVEVLFNNSHFDTGETSVGIPGGFGGPTEIPTEGTTEVIQIVNTTIDAHPIHIHLLQWQLVGRQAFDRVNYLNTYNDAWAAHTPFVPIWPAGLGYPGGAGSPYPYLTKNGDDAVGGNPAVGPFLLGSVMPANPEEKGWKDDIKSFPGEVATFVVRVAPTDRPINASQAELLLPFDPSIGPGYVWHCHIIDHEDMDMMRPLMILPSALRFPQITAQPQPLVSCVGSTETISVTATSDTEISYLWQISTDGGTVWNDMSNGAPYTGVLTSALHINPITALMTGLKYRVKLTNVDGVTTSNAALLTVDADVIVSVEITANKNNVFAGQSVTFTPIPTNGGSAPTYEWLVNSVVVGTGNTYRYDPVNNDQVAVRMTSNAHCAKENPATSSPIIITVLPSVSAANDGDWNTPATWTDGLVPTIADNVVIPDGRTITVNYADAYCNSVAIEGTLTSTLNSHTMTVATNVRTDDTFNIGANVLLINGATSGDGVIHAASGTIVYGGSSAQTISNIANNVMNNLSIDNKVGVTLPAALTVSTTLTINAGAKLTNPNASSLTVKNVSILSNLANGTGTFVDNGTTTTTVGGVANVQQYLTGGRNWYVSSPVTTATTASISTASSIQSYAENTVNWNLESTTLNVLKGYVANIATTGNITFAGDALNTGAKTVILTRLGAAKAGYNLVGNPYPSYLNWDNVTSNSSNLESTMWYRSKNAGNTAYVFDTYNSNGGIGTNNNGVRVTSQIPPIQAFWVRVASGTSGTLALDNTMRSHEGVVSNRLKTPELFTAEPKLYLQVSNGINSDEAIVVVNPNASNGFDPFDSEKMTNGNALVPEIYTFAGTEPVVINGLNSITPNQELALGFTTGESNTFNIKATDISNFDADTKIILKDKQLSVEKELTTANSYSFTSTPVSTSTRFSIVFKSPSVVTGNVNLGSENESLFIYRDKNNQINVHRINAIGEGTVTVFNSTGQKIVNIPTTGVLTLVDSKLLPGVYMVTVEVQGKSATKKITLY
jgi:FtsP/CotA-like multicopper oxidase with cupredoxin domain